MKDIAIYGAGAYGDEVACIINKLNKRAPTCNNWNFIGYFDDNESLWGKQWGNHGKVLGGIKQLNAWKAPLSLCVAVANVEFLKKIVDSVSNPLVSFPNIIDPDVSFVDEETVSFGIGNIIGEGSRIAPRVHFGDFNIVVYDGIFGHDDSIGSYNVFFPASRISGHVSIGNCNKFGVSSTVLQGFNIGNGVNLTPGAFLMSDSEDGFTYRGNPARKTIL